jgi:hypothetical protein
MKSWLDEDRPCAANPKLFDAPTGQGPLHLSERRRFAEAAKICGQCPFIADCRADRTVQNSEGFRHGQLFRTNKAEEGEPFTEIDWRQRPHTPPPPRQPHTIIHVTEQACPSCQQIKPAAAFPADRTRATQLGTYCTECRTAHRQAKKVAA